MKETREFAGKDVNKAVEKACAALGIAKNDLDYEVTSAGTSGIFGIVGRKDAKIKVTLPSEDANTSDEEMEGILSIVDEAFGEKPAQEAAPKPAPKKSAKPAPSKPKKKAETDRKEEDDNGRWDTKPASRPGKPVAEKKEEKELPPPVDVTQASIDLGKEALQKMADLITDDAHIEAITDQDRLTLQITGGNAGILIGRKGQTLDAMQFLTDKIINRQSEDRVRVKVDIEGYMETRKTNLKQLAFKMAEKAKKTGRPATINQMSAQDRRIVHLALKEDSQVRTQSMGDGYYRRLVIFPKKRNSYKGKRRLKK
ncbi:MAG: Jag N-terminal domain-containing protein [Desulfobacter sp.]|nr:Jag N-terminal domain-containing protein [Desulfobacter sp.]